MPLQVLVGSSYCGKYDVWTFGCVSYQLLVGDIPWKGTAREYRIALFNKYLPVEDIQKIPEMKINSTKVSYEGIKLLNKCLRIDKSKRCDWDQLFAEYFQKNAFYKQNQDEFKSGFNELLKGNYIN